MKIYNIEEIEVDEKNQWVIYTLPKKERHFYRLVLDTICFGFLSKFTEENKLNDIDSAYLLLIHYLHGAGECELDVAKQRTITVQTKLEKNGLGIMERVFRLGREGVVKQNRNEDHSALLQAINTMDQKVNVFQRYRW